MFKKEDLFRPSTPRDEDHSDVSVLIATLAYVTGGGLIIMLLIAFSL